MRGSDQLRYLLFFVVFGRESFANDRRNTLIIVPVIGTKPSLAGLTQNYHATSSFFVDIT